MCFKTTKQARAKIAKADIICWKFLEANFQPFYRMQLPPYLKKKVQPSIKIKKRVSFYGIYIYIIDEGYHSYKLEQRAEIHESYFCKRVVKGKDYHICKFIIPKGTRYFENETEYVSETIIRVN